MKIQPKSFNQERQVRVLNPVMYPNKEVEWLPTPFSELKPGDIFMLFDGPARSEYVVISEIDAPGAQNAKAFLAVSFAQPAGSGIMVGGALSGGLRVGCVPVILPDDVIKAVWM